MQISYYTERSPDRAPGVESEDFVIAGPTWAAVLDGATPVEGFPIGCIHGVAWFVRQLGAALATGLAVSDSALPDVLSGAIAATRSAHGDTCDLSNRASPSATVTLLRQRGPDVEYLVLADSPLVLDTNEGVRVIVDRNVQIPDFLPETIESNRNQPGGYWVASTNPAAAYEALTGSIAASDLRAAVLLTDGASRWVDEFGLGRWDDLVSVVRISDGPQTIVRDVRGCEKAKSVSGRLPSGDKRHDDATALVVVPTTDSAEQ